MAATASRGARRFVLTSSGFLVLWQVAPLLGPADPRRTGVALGLFGFVLHAVFGKAYALVPSYFDRQLAIPLAPTVQLPLSVVGTLALAAAARFGEPTAVDAVGAVLWALGVAVFLGTLGWTIRDNLTGRETATGAANADRRAVDRAANAFVPVALAYLAVGSYELLAATTALPGLLDGYPPRVSHLLGAGAATMLLFAVGFRLLPRFLVVRPPRALVAVVLPAGALAPALLAVGLPAGTLFRVGAVLEALAVIGFAVAVVTMLGRSDRRRVGFYGLLVGAVAGTLGVLLGLQFAFAGRSVALVTAHFRLNVLGFLGVTIVGVTYQFYPPAVSRLRGVGDRTALAAIVLLGGGLGLEVIGLAVGADTLVTAGQVGTLAGALTHAYVLSGLLAQQAGWVGA
jgi:hypothetical protein